VLPTVVPLLPPSLARELVAIVDADPRFNSRAAESNAVRLELARVAFVFWTDSPFAGIGVKNFRNELLSFTATDIPLAISMPGLGLVNVDGPHNFYLRVLAEQGLLGEIALLVVGVYLLRRALGLRRQSHGADRLVSEVAIGAFAVVAVFGLFGELISTGTLGLIFPMLLPATIEPAR
jgi:O-antigen ligase